jgi:hypothetical protein
MATTAHGYPYPVGTDRVMDGDDVIAALAAAIETKLGSIASGQATVPITTVNVLATVVVTLPVGRFIPAGSGGGVLAGLVTPLIVSGNPSNSSALVTALTDTTLTINGIRTVGSASFPVSWLVRQVGS